MERFSARQSRQIDGPPRLLHVPGSFSLGGKEARAVRLMNLWGDRARHSIVSAAPRLMSVREAVCSSIKGALTSRILLRLRSQANSIAPQLHRE